MNTLQKYEKQLYLILLIGVIIYFPIFFNGFVWDDYTFILNNSQIHQINIPVLFGPSNFNSGPFYRPLPAVYFAIIYSLSGAHAFFYHFLQLALHLVDSFLLFLFFCLFFSEDISFFLALLFLVHPINVESVAFIGSTQSELYFLPGISALLLASKKELTKTKFLLTIGLLCVCIFTKETGFIYIPLIILYRYLFRLGKLKEFLYSGVALVVFYLLARIFVGHVTFNEATYIPIASLPLNIRLINIPAILTYYTQTFFFPLILTIWQSWIITTITPLSFYMPLFICLVIAVLITAGGIFFYKYDKKMQSKKHLLSNEKHNKHALDESTRFPQYLFFLVWLILGIGMILQIVPLDMTVSDRWFYFPIVGFLGMIGVILEYFLPSIKQHYKTYTYIALIIICLLSLRTFIRTFDWKNNITIYADARHLSNNYMLDNAYALQLYNTGKHDEAISYDKRSIAISPTMINVSLLGVIYQKSGQCDKAIPIFNQALTYYKPTVQQVNQSGINSQDDYSLGSIYFNLTDCYLQEGQPQDAIDLLTNKALKKFPKNGLLYVNLAVSYSENNEHQQAVKAITKAYSLDPSPTVEELYNRFKNNYLSIPQANPVYNSEPANPSLQNQIRIVNPQILPQYRLM